MMAVPTMEESALCSQLFEEWYKTKYHKDYEWRN